MKKIKLYLNENLSAEIAQRLTVSGFDAISSHEVGMDTEDDEKQIAYAVSQERAIVTINKKDFIVIHNEYLQMGKAHFGIILSTDEDHWVIYRRLLKLLAFLDLDEMRNEIRWLNDFKW